MPIILAFERVLFKYLSQHHPISLFQSTECGNNAYCSSVGVCVAAMIDPVTVTAAPLAATISPFIIVGSILGSIFILAIAVLAAFVIVKKGRDCATLTVKPICVCW